MAATDRHAGRNMPLFVLPDSGQVKWSTESVILPEPWTAEALCAQIDPNIFFPEKGGSTRQAKAICAACDVAAQCLEYALRNDERFGIWGSLSEQERRRIRRSAAPVSKKQEATRVRGHRPRLVWTLEEDDRLRKLAGMGWSNVRIGADLGRAHSAVRSRRKALGLAPSEWRGCRSAS